MKRVLFATIAAGGGHVAMSRAIAANLAQYYPGEVTSTISDLMLEYGAAELDARHKRAWQRMLEMGPWLRAGQRVMDAAPSVTRLVQQRMLHAFGRSLPEQLDPLGYDLIITTHGWLITALNTAIAHGLRTPVMHFAIEPFDGNALWADTRSTHVVTTSLAAASDLAHLGVASRHVIPIGYPVPPTLLTPRDQADARKSFGLQNQFTVLFSIGAEGVGGPVVEVATALAQRSVQVVVLTGRNEALQRALVHLALPGVLPVPFTDRVLDYVAAADLVLAKAGPSSIFEALAQGKPLIITKMAARNELRNMEFVVGRGFGRYATKAPDIVAAVEDYQRVYERTGSVQIDTSALQLAATNERCARYVGFHLDLEESPPQLDPPIGVGAHDIADRRRYARRGGG